MARRSLCAVGVVVAAAAVACSDTGAVRPVSNHSSQSPRPVPTTTVVRDHPTLRVGATGVVASRREHASLRMTAGVPRVSDIRLSPSYGYPPANGHYVTFRITIVNTGRTAAVIRPLDFFVRTPGAPHVTTDQGNAPYSGSGRQLDSTELSPRQRVSNNLTFDVRRTTGRLCYAPGGRIALAWRF